MKKRKMKIYMKTVEFAVDDQAIQIYKNYVGNSNGFMLESYEEINQVNNEADYDNIHNITNAKNNRFTIIGSDVDEIIHSDKNSLVIEKKDGEKEVRKGNPYKLLKQYYEEFDILNLEDFKKETNFNFSGGLVGSLGFDFIRYIDKIPNTLEDKLGIERIQLMFSSRILVIDHYKRTLNAIVLYDPYSHKEKNISTVADYMIIKARFGKEIKEENDILNTENYKNFDKQGIIDGKLIDASDTLESYTKKVKKIKEYIRDGHVFQTVLSQRWTVATRRDGLEIYEQLRKQNPSPYMFYFKFPEFEIIGSSPEMLVKQKNDKVFTCPIAGTRKRGQSYEEDMQLEKELISDEKEQAEHVMLVDLARNDMGKIAKFGSVKVEDFMKIKRFSQVMHIVSLVSGEKNEKIHPLDVIGSFLPAGTLSGAPKHRALEIIEELEESKRGLYGGATGYIDFSGNLDFCITIRTMVKKANEIYIQAGAGIVADSVPKLEYEECCNKAKALMKTIVEEEKMYDIANR